MIRLSLIEYRLNSEALCLGERIKKGTFRPTITTIPYSQITGALKSVLGMADIHATGCITNEPKKEYLTFSPKDNITNVSKIPITVEFLVNVEGRIYIAKNPTYNFPSSIELVMGALRTRGLGNCIMNRIGEIDFSTREARIMNTGTGLLNTRIPIEYLDKFSVRSIRPRYGYLFKPTSMTSGVYVLSLFENSEVNAPRALLK